MKQRIISALVGVALLVLLLVAHNTIIFNLAIAFISAIGVFEILHCIRVNKISVYLSSMAYAFIVPIASSIDNFVPVFVFSIFYAILMLTVMLKNHNEIKFEKICSVIASTFLLTFAFNSLANLKDIESLYPEYYKANDGIFLLMMVLICSWGTDTGAYFTGVCFGKHKLAPQISPKKTIEGAVGGVIVCLIINMISVAIFNGVVFKEPHINYLLVAFISIVLSIVGMVGDLTASIIKRNFKVKDYGHIMPGHGGVMDRFDSISFVAPCLYAIMILVANF